MSVFQRKVKDAETCLKITGKFDWETQKEKSFDADAITNLFTQSC